MTFLVLALRRNHNDEKKGEEDMRCYKLAAKIPLLAVGMKAAFFL